MSIPNSIASRKSPTYFHTRWLRLSPPTLRCWNVLRASRFRELYCSASSFVSLLVRIIEPTNASFLWHAASHSAFTPCDVTASIRWAKRVTIPCACFLAFGYRSKVNVSSSPNVKPLAAVAISCTAVSYKRSTCFAYLSVVL